MKISDKNNLPAPERYEYLINTAKENRTIWLLQERDGLFAMFEDDNGTSYVPVWPEQEIAESFAKDEWEGYLSEKMSLYEYSNWVKELKDDAIMIAAWPDENMQIIPLDPAVFMEHLKL